jgi:hypothetical protein
VAAVFLLLLPCSAEDESPARSPFPRMFSAERIQFRDANMVVASHRDRWRQSSLLPVTNPGGRRLQVPLAAGHFSGGSVMPSGHDKSVSVVNQTTPTAGGVVPRTGTFTSITESPR